MNCVTFVSPRQATIPEYWWHSSWLVASLAPTSGGASRTGMADSRSYTSGWGPRRCFPLRSGYQRLFYGPSFSGAAVDTSNCRHFNRVLVVVATTWVRSPHYVLSTFPSTFTQKIETGQRSEMSALDIIFQMHHRYRGLLQVDLCPLGNC